MPNITIKFVVLTRLLDADDVNRDDANDIDKTQTSDWASFNRWRTADNVCSKTNRLSVNSLFSSSRPTT